MKAIASHNGLPAVEYALAALRDGQSPLDAVVAGVTAIEDDPADLTVGYGGLPNEEGVVELDAAVMDGPTHRGAGVAALRNVRHATQVARRVLEQTDRCLLAGEGALDFARANGFPEENLLTERARRMWLYWKRRRGRDDWRDPGEQEDLELERWYAKHFYGGGGTVHCAAMQPGHLAAATSTSGHAFKIPGRVGDSPILGAGLYVDNEFGSCGSIGHGEANQENLTSFLVVELLRAGRTPEEAALEALERVDQHSRANRRNADGKAEFNLQLFVLTADGQHLGAALWGPKQFAVADGDGARLEDCVSLYERGA